MIAVYIVKYISIVLVGLVAGATFYSSVVEIPVRQKTAEEDQLKNWILVFAKASSILKTMGIITMLSILITGYLTENWYWYVGAVPLFLLMPFTAIFIAKVNDEIMALTSSVGVSKLIKKWDRLHHIRTILSLIAFGICCLAALT